MAIFIDTADLAQIKKWATLPFVKGVTTNPLVLQAANITDRFSRLRAIHELLRADQKLMIQAVGNDAVEILKDAHRIHENFPSAIVKIPTTWEGLSIAAPLQDAKMLLCYTMIFSAAQGVLGALTKAHYIAPYVGRMRQANIDPWNEIVQMQAAIRANQLDCRILTASLRTPEDIARALSLGCDPTAKVEVWEACLSQAILQEAFSEFTAAHIQ